MKIINILTGIIWFGCLILSAMMETPWNWLIFSCILSLPVFVLFEGKKQ